MEKQGIIAPGVTPPEEEDGIKVASVEELEQDPVKRLADKAAEACSVGANKDATK